MYTPENHKMTYLTSKIDNILFTLLNLKTHNLSNLLTFLLKIL